ncbi:hypothetical protein [Lelliottia nimipressuralis]
MPCDFNGFSTSLCLLSGEQHWRNAL